MSHEWRNQDVRAGGLSPIRLLVGCVLLSILRERRRRSAIEPVIGHMKSDGHLGRNFLLGTEGDATNLVLAAAGHNLRRLRAWLAWLLACLLSLLRSVQQAQAGHQSSPAAA